MAIAAAIAFVVYSCGPKLGVAEELNIEEIPVQVVNNMFAVKSTNGKTEMRMEAPLMTKFERDTATIEVFTGGFSVYTYKMDGLLETIILSDKARHIKSKRRRTELWELTGDVCVQNVINRQTMETDTIFWDMQEEKFYTNSYVRMYSDDGFMQGYGMHSDDKGLDAILHRPFNSYGYVVRDTTLVSVDTVNFIGPFPKNR